MKNYPIQTFLFRKTKDAIKARKFMDDVVEDPDLSDYYDKSISEAGRVKRFVLDGQQRLQSLFTAFDGTFNGEDLYINILDGESEVENGLSYRFKNSKNKLELPYFRLRSLNGETRNAEDISDEVNQKLTEANPDEDPKDKNKRERIVRKNIGQLVSILREDKHLWIDELDGFATDGYPYQRVLDIFIRVNSGGTKLDAADLMFAVMKEAWAEIEQNMEEIVEGLNKHGRVLFEKSFPLKCLMLASGKGATLDLNLFMGDKGDANLKELEANWTKASRAFEQLTDFIYNDLKVYSDKVIRSYNAFVPIFEYFYLQPSPSPEDRQLLKSYYYRSQLFNWYSQRTDQILDAVHNILAKNKTSSFPLYDVTGYFAQLGKDNRLEPRHLDDIRLRYILLNLIYVERMGGSPFDVAYKGNEPHIDHIYPKSKLKQLPTSEVNHIGNYRYVGAADNLRKRAEEPASYFGRLQKSKVDISRHLLVDEFAQDPAKLTLSNYSRFRDTRMKVVFDICANVVNR